MIDAEIKRKKTRQYLTCLVRLSDKSKSFGVALYVPTALVQRMRSISARNTLKPPPLKAAIA